LRYYKVGEVVEAIPLVMEKLRSRGFRVGVSESVDLAVMLRTYSSLTGRDALPDDELREIVYAVIKAPGAPEAFMEELRGFQASQRVSRAAERIESEIGEMLRTLGVAPGWRVSRRKASRRGREALAAYLQLRRVGVITGRPGSERVVDPQEIRRIALSLARRGVESLEEAYRSMRPMRGRDVRLMEAEAGIHPRIDSMDEARLVELGWAAARKGNVSLVRAVASELRRRLEKGSLGAVDEAFRLLRTAGYLDPRLASDMIASSPGLVEECGFLGSREYAAAISRAVRIAGVEKGGEIVAKALKRADEETAEAIVSMVPAEALWAVKRHPFTGDKGRLLDAAVKAARSLRSAIKYLEGGGEGWRDLALEEAEEARRAAETLSGVRLGRLDPSSVSTLSSTASSLARAGPEALGEALLGSIASTLGLPETVRILRAAYRRAGSAESRRLLVLSMERLLARMASREGLRLLPRWRLGEIRGRVEVRRSIYRMVRGSQDPLVFREKVRAARISLALDISGSMIDYSSWALLVASLFTRNIERLVLFSHTVRVLEGPFKARQLAEILISMEFKGFTNISAAVRAAAEGASRRVVVVTDLKQTVDGEPVHQAVASVRRSGKTVIFVTTPSAPWDEVERVESAGGRVVIAYTPRQAAQRILRVLLR